MNIEYITAHIQWGSSKTSVKCLHQNGLTQQRVQHQHSWWHVFPSRQKPITILKKILVILHIFCVPTIWIAIYWSKFYISISIIIPLLLAKQNCLAITIIWKMPCLYQGPYKDTQKSVKHKQENMNGFSRINSNIQIYTELVFGKR